MCGWQLLIDTGERLLLALVGSDHERSWRRYLRRLSLRGSVRGSRKRRLAGLNALIWLILFGERKSRRSGRRERGLAELNQRADGSSASASSVSSASSATADASEAVKARRMCINTHDRLKAVQHRASIQERTFVSKYVRKISPLEPYWEELNLKPPSGHLVLRMSRVGLAQLLGG